MKEKGQLVGVSKVSDAYVVLWWRVELSAYGW